MRSLRFLSRRPLKRAALLLIPVVALGGPIGCGPELVAGIGLSEVLAIAGIALTLYQINQVESAKLDCGAKSLRLEGTLDGQPVTIDRPLSDHEFRSIRSKGTVNVNGTTLPVATFN
jgi:hypothetical protein